MKLEINDLIKLKEEFKKSELSDSEIKSIVIHIFSLEEKDVKLEIVHDYIYNHDYDFGDVFQLFENNQINSNKLNLEFFNYFILNKHNLSEHINKICLNRFLKLSNNYSFNNKCFGNINFNQLKLETFELLENIEFININHNFYLMEDCYLLKSIDLFFNNFHKYSNEELKDSIEMLFDDTNPYIKEKGFLEKLFVNYKDEGKLIYLKKHILLTSLNFYGNFSFDERKEVLKYFFTENKNFLEYNEIIKGYPFEHYSNLKSLINDIFKVEPDFFNGYDFTENYHEDYAEIFNYYQNKRLGMEVNINNNNNAKNKRKI